MMRIPILLRILFAGLLILVVISVGTALAATNIVPPTRITSQTFPITPNDLKPSGCGGLDLTDIVSGSGTITGTSGNDLILGSPNNDTINGMGGNDCILGAGGDDVIDGGDGMNICIGGPGNDTFANCEGESQ